MADEEKEEKKEEGAKEGSAKKKGGNKVLIFVIVGVFVLLVAIGTPVAFFMLNKEPVKELGHADKDAAHAGDDAVVEGFEEEEEWEEDEEALGAIFPLETFVVNLAGGGYLRCQAQLEFVSRDVPQRFYVRLVQIRDVLVTLLSSRTKEMLEKEKGRGELKNDIKDTVNEVLRRQEVEHVYFTQFIIQ